MVGFGDLVSTLVKLMWDYNPLKMGNLYPIYFCPVGTSLAFRLNIVPDMDAFEQKRLTLNQLLQDP